MCGDTNITGHYTLLVMMGKLPRIRRQKENFVIFAKKIIKIIYLNKVTVPKKFLYVMVVIPLVIL